MDDLIDLAAPLFDEQDLSILSPATAQHASPNNPDLESQLLQESRHDATTPLGSSSTDGPPKRVAIAKTVAGVRVLVGLVCLAGFALCTAGIATAEEGAERMLMVGIPVAFVLALANGANDIANSVGTSVGCNALTLRQAVWLGALMEFLGAVTTGASVSATFTDGVVHRSSFDEPLLYAFGMLCAVIGAGSTTLAATLYGLPISATHGIVAGLIGFGLVSRGPDVIDTPKVVATLLTWVASPFVGMLFTCLLYSIIRKFVLLAPHPVKRSHRAQPVFLGLLCAILSEFLMEAGPPALRSFPHWVRAVIAVLAGAAAAAARAIYQCSHPAKASKLADDGPEAPFKPLLVMSAFALAFAHGGNDVANAIGPVQVMWQLVFSENATAAVVALSNTTQPTSVAVATATMLTTAAPNAFMTAVPQVNIWVLLLGATGFAVGIIGLGHRTIETVGSKIADLSPSKSFSTQMGATVAVLISSVLQMPVSTSHCLVGSVIGCSLAQQLVTSQDSADNSTLSLGVLKKIVLGWVTTIPAAAAVTLVAYFSLYTLFL